MKKSIFLFALLLVGVLTTSAVFQDRIKGKWFVQYIKVEGNEQEFSNESEAPWMDFKNDDVLLLGEPGSERSRESTWTYDKALGILHFTAFGEELALLDYKTTEATDSTLVIKAHNGKENAVILKLNRHL